MNIPTLKEKFLSSLDSWFNNRVNEMVKDNPTLTVPAVYIKRGCHNIINKYDKRRNSKRPKPRNLADSDILS